MVKSKKAETLIDDLKETFAALDVYQIKLNPKKCSFVVPKGELLGYLLSARGIKANQEKIQAILTMKEPTNVKGVQQLAGRVAALSRFIAKLGEKALPFYKLLKKSDTFEWMQEAREAFQALKRTLSTSPVLVMPQGKAADVPIYSSNKASSKHSTRGQAIRRRIHIRS